MIHTFSTCAHHSYHITYYYGHTHRIMCIINIGRHSNRLYGQKSTTIRVPTYIILNYYLDVHYITTSKRTLCHVCTKGKPVFSCGLG